MHPLHGRKGQGQIPYGYVWRNHADHLRWVQCFTVTLKLQQRSQALVEIEAVLTRTCVFLLRPSDDHHHLLVHTSGCGELPSNTGSTEAWVWISDIHQLDRRSAHHDRWSFPELPAVLTVGGARLQPHQALPAEHARQLQLRLMKETQEDLTLKLCSDCCYCLRSDRSFSCNFFCPLKLEKIVVRIMMFFCSFKEKNPGLFVQMILSLSTFVLYLFYSTQFFCVCLCVEGVKLISWNSSCTLY